MSSSIHHSLHQYIRAYHKQQWMRGLLRWLMMVSFISGFVFYAEYLFWLSSIAKTILFVSLLSAFSYWCYAWILKPLIHFYGGLGKLTEEDAARKIGREIPVIGDKLLNYLQLNHEAELSNSQSINVGLLKASIDQKTVELSRVPILESLPWGEYRNYTKKVTVALIFIGLIYISQASKLGEGIQRMANFSKTYVPQAPFKIRFLNSWEIVEGSPLLLEASIEGRSFPESIEFVCEGQNKKFKKLGPSSFTLRKEDVRESMKFMVKAAGFEFGPYEVRVIKRPQWDAIELFADYPDYTGAMDGPLAVSNRLSVPEGTVLSWTLRTKYADKLWLTKGVDNAWMSPVEIGNKYKLLVKSPIELRFLLKGKLGAVSDTIASSIAIVSDLYPNLEVQSIADSFKIGTWYLSGLASDDYGISSIKFHYRAVGKGLAAKDTQWQHKAVFDGQKQQVGIAFGLDSRQLVPTNAAAIEYYFSAVDNDKVNGGKTTKTEIRTLKLLDEISLVRTLEKQEAGIGKGMSSGVKELKEMQREAGKLQESMRNERSLDWNQESKVEKFIQEQQKMLNTLKQLQQKQEKINEQKKNLNPVKPELQQKKDEINKQLKQLSNPEMQKLLEEINKLLQQKADKQQLQQKMDEVKSMNRQQAMELEKLMEQLKSLELEEAVDLQLKAMQEWIEKQEALEKKTQGATKSELAELKKEQEQLNQDLNKLDEGSKEIEEKNKALEKPMELNRGEKARNDAKEEAKQAAQNLGEQKKSAATEKQRKSAEKMKEAMQQLEQSFQKEQEKRMAEDYQTLRALLDNLIELSGRQETHFLELRKINADNPRLSFLNKEQMKLKESWLFLEDSLEALAKRQMAINQFVTKELNGINYRMEESLERLRVRNLRQAAVEEQYVMSGMNSLADMLMESLQNMQQQMQQQQKEGNQACSNPNNSGKGKGKPKPGGKLSEGQEKLGEQLQKLQQMKQGKSGGAKGGQNQKPGEGDNSGDGDESKRMNQELAKMALMQEQLRRQVEQLRKEMGGGDPSTNQLLKETEQLMEQQERDIVNGKIGAQNVDRQKQIMTRLLEHEKADRKQGEEDKRESNKGNGLTAEVPPEIKAEVLKKVSEKEQLRKSLPGLTPYYQNANSEFLRGVR